MSDGLNLSTQRVVAALTESWDFIQETKNGRKKPLARKYASGEESLEKALQEAADELIALYHVCLDYNQDFARFDSEAENKMRKLELEGNEIKGAIKYTMDPKKSVKDPETLHRKALSIGTEASKVLNDWSRRVMSNAQREAAAGRAWPIPTQASTPSHYAAAIASQETARRTPASPDDMTFDAPPPEYSAVSAPSRSVPFSPMPSVPEGQSSMMDRGRPPNVASARSVSAPRLEGEASAAWATVMSSFSSTAIPPEQQEWLNTAPPRDPPAFSDTATLATLQRIVPDERSASSATAQSVSPARRTSSNLMPPPSSSPPATRRWFSGRSSSTSGPSTSISPPSHSGIDSRLGEVSLSDIISPIATSGRTTSIYSTSTVASDHSGTSSAAPSGLSTGRTQSRSLSHVSDINISYNPKLGTEIKGIPNKHNNWWGFCGGAWSIQSGDPKALVIRTMPAGGMYSSRQFIECAESGCRFQGRHCSSSSKVPAVDSMVLLHPSTGIKFRWIFLAKCHLKCKSHDMGQGINAMKQDYGCLFCVTDGHATPTMGGVDALMQHILRAHSDSMSAEVKKRNNVITGCIALPGETFDLNIPETWEDKCRREEDEVAGPMSPSVEIGDGTPRTPELPGSDGFRYS